MASPSGPSPSPADTSVDSQPNKVDKLRKLIDQYIEQHQYGSALFWADKVMSLSNGEVQDVYRYAQCLFQTGQHHRASQVIRKKKLDKEYAECRYLAAKCHACSKEWQEALDILENYDPLDRTKSQDTSLRNDTTQINPDVSSSRTESAIYLLKGQILEALDFRPAAVENYRLALKFDVYCYEALDALIQHNMMTSQEEREVIESLPFSEQADEGEIELIRFLYENKIKKYDKPCEVVLPSTISQLSDNLDVITDLAEQFYYNCDFRACLKITNSVLGSDCYHMACLPIHIACLVELNKSNDLFFLGHRLVSHYPEHPISWFAVGCYYFLTANHEPARRYLSKATSLDSVFGPAWLAYGHSFASDGEHDQAMAAYFTASKIMKGCHLPSLYIGLEYGLTNNVKLAERFFNQALSIAPDDPFVLHEMGVVAFQNDDWETAETYFKQAMEKLEAIEGVITAEKWEPLFNNLGHVYRKLTKYEDSLHYHLKALSLLPQNASTLTCIAFDHALIGQYDSAIEYFHKALGLRRDDTLSVTMLVHCIEQSIASGESCPDDESQPDGSLGPRYGSRSDDVFKVNTPSSPGLPRPMSAMSLSDAEKLDISEIEMEDASITNPDQS